MVALTCAWCGAPLARPQASLVTCAYCGATSSLAGPRPTRAARAASAPPAPPPDLAVRVVQAFALARQQGSSPYDALVAASRERLGPLGETDALARVVLALADDFDHVHGTRVVDEATAMGRLIEAYLSAIAALRSQGYYDMSLPYFSSTERGPAYFSRRVTPEIIAELASRAPPPPKKRGLFSF